MSRFLFVSALLFVGTLIFSACDSSDPRVDPEPQSLITHTQVAEKDGADAPWITWQESTSEYNDRGRRIRGRLFLYEDNGSTRFIQRDTLWYSDDGAFLRRRVWTQNVADGETGLTLDRVRYAEEVTADGVAVVITETPDGELSNRYTYRYDGKPFEPTEVISERWRDGAWQKQYRVTYLERDAAGRALLRRTEEWVDGTWRLDTFFDQIERDEEGRVVRASEDGDKPMTFTYDDEGRLIQKTKKRSRNLDDRWRYEYTEGPVRKMTPLRPAGAASHLHTAHR